MRQEAILDIARHLIASEGLANVTFVALARALRLSVATLSPAQEGAPRSVGKVRVTRQGALG